MPISMGVLKIDVGQSLFFIFLLLPQMFFEIEIDGVICADGVSFLWAFYLGWFVIKLELGLLLEIVWLSILLISFIWVYFFFWV